MAVADDREAAELLGGMMGRPVIRIECFDRGFRIDDRTRGGMETGDVDWLARANITDEQRRDWLDGLVDIDREGGWAPGRTA